jgi:hypothetical protein
LISIFYNKEGKCQTKSVFGRDPNSFMFHVQILVKIFLSKSEYFEPTWLASYQVTKFLVSISLD